MLPFSLLCFTAWMRTALPTRLIVPLNQIRGGNARRASNKLAASDSTMKYDVLLDGVLCNVEVTRSADEPSHVLATINGRRVEADAVKISPGVYSILLDGRSIEVRAETLADSLLLHAAGREYRAEICWRPARSIPPLRLRRHERGPPTDFGADGRKSCARSGCTGAAGGNESRSAGRGSHENAERNSLDQNRDGRTAVRQGRPDCERRRNSRGDRVAAQLGNIQCHV